MQPSEDSPNDQIHMPAIQQSWLVVVGLVFISLMYHPIISVIASRKPAFANFYNEKIGIAIIQLGVPLAMVLMIAVASKTIYLWHRKDLYPMAIPPFRTWILPAFLGVVTSIIYLKLLKEPYGSSPRWFSRLEIMVIPMVVGAIADQIIFTGFLFSKFRKDHTLLTTTFFIVLIELLCRTTLWAGPWIVLSGPVGGSILCILFREKTGSLIPALVFKILFVLMVVTTAFY